jgi:hypothetical protein
VLPNTIGAVDYFDSTHGDYRLAATASNAIDQGLVIPGVTDGYVGNAPDNGAYEFGAPLIDWIPGCNMAACQDPMTPNRRAP